MVGTIIQAAHGLQSAIIVWVFIHWQFDDVSEETLRLLWGPKTGCQEVKG
jgi:hypothetical protein